MFAHGETVTVLAAATSEDEYGNTVESWDVPTEVAVVDGVGVEPRPVGESFTEDRNAVTSGFTLYMPDWVEVSALHRIEVRGSVYSVLGEPAVWRSPFTGWAPGVVVQVGRTDG